MSLVIQIKTIIYSFFFGIYFCLFIKFSKKIIYHKKRIIKIIGTFLITLFNFLLYFLLLQKINNGVFHIYEFLCVCIGYILTFFIAPKIKK